MVLPTENRHATQASNLRTSNFQVKFIPSLSSSRFDWQMRNEIVKFVANFGNFKRTCLYFTSVKLGKPAVKSDAF